MTVLRARLVCPVTGPPIVNGTVRIEDGRILDVGPSTSVGAIDVGSAAIIPGLVNAHTHLEFSNLTGPLGPAVPFADWIGSVVAERRRRTADRDFPIVPERDPIQRGLTECFHTGTALVGEITTSPLEAADRPDEIQAAVKAQRLIPFRELLAPRSGPGEDNALLQARDFLGACGSLGHGVFGLSPHTPFTTTDRVLEEAIAISARDRLPLAMHVAETREEIELLLQGTGPLREMLDRVGLWDANDHPAGRRPLEILQKLARSHRALVIHGNYLTMDELTFVGAQPHLSLVYCPRTHRYFGHSRYPLTEALQRGVNVALGTDSRASNPDLNLWQEARLACRLFPEVAPHQILEMATVRGARALGMLETAGILAPGRRADLAVVSLPDDEPATVEALLNSGSDVCGVMHAGQWLRSPAWS